MTTAEYLEPALRIIRQWLVLTNRLIAPTLRNGELVTGICASVVFTAGFYIPLRRVMSLSLHGMSYAQFLTPLIVLQAISFASITGAFRAANDSVQGVNRRFGTMPIPFLLPFSARMSASCYRCTIALVMAIISGYVIGFRFDRDPMHTVAFFCFAMLVGFALSFVADLIGTISKNPEATAQLLTIPQLIFGMLSVGVQPPDRFPGWIQPIVRNQPVSQFVCVLRAFAGSLSTSGADTVTWSLIWPSLAWLCGLVALLIPLSFFVLARSR